MSRRISRAESSRRASGFFAYVGLHRAERRSLWLAHGLGKRVAFGILAFVLP